MQEYELTVILDPDILEEDVPQAMEKLNALIAKNGGDIIETDHWGRRRLSYPIKRHAEGNYVMLKMQMEPDQTSELESEMNITSDYLRHLLIRVGE